MFLLSEVFFKNKPQTYPHYGFSRVRLNVHVLLILAPVAADGLERILELGGNVLELCLSRFSLASFLEKINGKTKSRWFQFGDK